MPTHTFTNADGTVIGDDWLEKTDAAGAISGNRLEISGYTFPNSVVYRPPADDFEDGYAECDFTASVAGAIGQVHVRYDPTGNNSLYCYYFGGNLIIAKLVSGTGTQLASKPFTIDTSEEYKLKMEVYGNFKRATIYRKNTSGPTTWVPITAVEESSDSTITGSGSHGVSNDTTGTVSYDNYTWESVDATINLTGQFHDGSAVVTSVDGIDAYLLDYKSKLKYTTVNSLTINGSGTLSGISDDLIDAEARYSARIDLNDGRFAYIRRTDKNWPKIFVSSESMVDSYYLTTKYDGLGIPGSEIPSSGTNEPSIIRAAVESTVEDNNEFRIDVYSGPTVLTGSGDMTFVGYDDGSFNALIDSGTNITAAQLTFNLVKDNTVVESGMTADFSFSEQFQPNALDSDVYFDVATAFMPDSWNVLVWDGEITDVTTSDSFREKALDDASLGGGGFSADSGDWLCYMVESGTGFTMNDNTTWIVDPPADVSGYYRWYDHSTGTLTNTSTFEIIDGGYFSEPRDVDIEVYFEQATTFVDPSTFPNELNAEVFLDEATSTDTTLDGIEDSTVEVYFDEATSSAQGEFTPDDFIIAVVLDPMLEAPSEALIDIDVYNVRFKS